MERTEVQAETIDVLVSDVKAAEGRIKKLEDALMGARDVLRALTMNHTWDCGCALCGTYVQANEALVAQVEMEAR